MQAESDSGIDTVSEMSADRVPVSVVILAKNEESNIARCLQSLAWSDDVIVIDDGSTDSTVEVAQRIGAKVVEHKFESFAKQRNWALQSVEFRHDWVLMLDADETATPELVIAIQDAIRDANEEVVAFRLCRKTMLMGKWLKYSDGFPVWIMRLTRLGKAAYQDSGHGEVPVPEVDGAIGTIREPFVHYPFSKGLSDWVTRHNRYSSREAELELHQEADTNSRQILSRDAANRRRALRAFSRRLPLRPVLRFFYQYVWKWGFLDGRAGLAFSFLMAVYEGLIVLKRWEFSLQQKGEKL